MNEDQSIFVVAAIGVLMLLAGFVMVSQAPNHDEPQPSPQWQSPIPQQPQMQPQPQPSQPEFPEYSSYTGVWNTKKYRKLDGPMTCDVHYLGNQQWQGKFHGSWHGMPFSYDVSWSGPPEQVQGTATIDGADYTWTGSLTSTRFTGRFDSRRYVGDFNLQK